MARKKKVETVNELEETLETVVTPPPEVVKAQTVLPSGLVLLSDGGRTTSSRGVNGFSVKVGDQFVKNDDGTYRRAKLGA